MDGPATDQDGTQATEQVPYRRVTVTEAAEIRGVSVVTIRRMIKRGELEAERVIRPQGSAYLVTLPEDGTGNADDAPPTQQPAQNMSRTQATPADQMMVLIETTISTAVEAAITPLVTELANTRRTVQEQAETIGRVTAERDALVLQLSAVQEPQPAPIAVRPASEPPVPVWRGWWLLVLALAGFVVIVALLGWPR